MIHDYKSSDNGIFRNDVKWPDYNPRTKQLFLGRPSLRKMRVMIDSDLTQTCEKEKVTKLEVLTTLLDHDYIDYVKYAIVAPDDAIESQLSRRLSVHPTHVGYVIPYDNEDGTWAVRYAFHDKQAVNAYVAGDLIQYAYKDENDHTYEENAAERRKADLLALEVAKQALGVDMYITERAYLHSENRIVKPNGTIICAIDQALTLVSLYLRVQDEFPIPTGLSSVKMNFDKGMFYWVGARELLPEAWRVHTAAVRHSKEASNNKIQMLAGSLLGRMDKTLRARDSVHIALSRPVNNGTNDDALASLDNVLVLLMGAVDATARIAHNVLGLRGNDYSAAWQQTYSGRRWLDRVEAQSPALKETALAYEDTLTILRFLRNSVHGEALRAVSFSNNGAPLEMLVGLPKDEEDSILEAMDRLGGRTIWGFKHLSPGRNYIQPGIFVDKLLEEVVTFLNAIMKDIPVEQLPGSMLTPEDLVPPVSSPFTENERLSIRWQLGL